MGLTDPSLRAKPSNPEAIEKVWIASSLTLLAMTANAVIEAQNYRIGL
jgi:hypothetical protein